jgi:hypothetical protein
VLAIDYRWWVLVHLIGVFGFLLAHGVSTTVLFKVRKERDRDKIRSLLQLSGSTVLPAYMSLLVLLIGGVAGAFQVHFWGFKWIRLSLGILIVAILLMGGIARPYYVKIKEATALRPSGAPRISDEELAAKLSSPVPVAIAVIGFVSLLSILYLMVFKPL